MSKMTFPTRAEKRLPVEVLRQLISYEPETGDLRWKYRPQARTEWNNKHAGTVAGTLTKKGSVQINITSNGHSSLYHAHRIAWALMTGEWPTHRLDHSDCDPANNKWANLRPATCSQNNANRSNVDGAVPYRGVYFMRSKGRYAAQIKKDRQHTWLGLHDTAEDAARAYDRAANQLFGEYAKTNSSLGLL